MNTHVAIPLYADFTALDAIGPYTVLGFAGWRVSFVAAEAGTITDDLGGLSLTVSTTFDQLPNPDVIVVPGGPVTLPALEDARLLEWIGNAHSGTTWTTSVCTGSLLLGAAGLLDGRSATTHWALMDVLPRYGATPAEERVVIDEPVMTAAGVSAGIDMALTLLARMTDTRTAQRIQLAVEYDPRPPFNAGSPRTAPADLTEELRVAMAGAVNAG